MTKLSSRQEAALRALLTTKTVKEAAEAVGITPETLARWKADPAFAQAYAAARRRAIEEAIGRLQQASGDAVSALSEVVNDKLAADTARVSAARSILEFALRGTETLDIVQRLDTLEAAIQAQEAEA